MNKSELRSICLKKRNSLSKEEIKVKSQEICRTLCELEAYKNAREIYLYADYNNEVETKWIFERALKDGKRIAYPKSFIESGIPKMEFYYISSLAMLTEGYKGIMEPDVNRKEAIKVSEYRGLCIVPGSAFDEEGNRLGYGKGFYDRFLMDKKEVNKLAICFEEQIVEKIEAGSLDVRMDMIVTEKRYIGWIK